jgi:hypothetical protein
MLTIRGSFVCFSVKKEVAPKKKKDNDAMQKLDLLIIT